MSRKLALLGKTSAVHQILYLFHAAQRNLTPRRGMRSVVKRSDAQREICELLRSFINISPDIDSVFARPRLSDLLSVHT